MRHILLALAIVPTSIAQVDSLSCNRSLPIEEPVVAAPEQVKCLAVMIYGEARGETDYGKVGVAYTAVNRAVNSPKSTVCKQVLAPMQYSVFNGNAALKAAAMSLHLEPKQHNEIDKASWKQSVEVAQMVLEKGIADPTAGSTHYLAPIAMKSLGYKYPKWSYQYKKSAVIDRHVFYKPYYPGKKDA